MLKSRKFIIALAAMLLISLGWMLTIRWPGLSPTFGEFGMLLLGAAGLYSGANVWANRRAKKAAQPPAP